MKGYRIKTVASATGLSPELLRAWERRYKVVTPTRSTGGYREYSEQDVGKLRLLRDLTGRGFAIGEVAALPIAELERLVRGRGDTQAAALPAAPQSTSDVLVEFAVAGNAAGLRDGLRRTLAMLPREDAIETVLLPMLRELGWREEKDGQTLARRLAAEEIRGFVGAIGQAADSPLVLVATPARRPSSVLLVETLLYCLAAGLTPVCTAVRAGEMASTAQTLGAELVVLCQDEPSLATDILRWPPSPHLIVVGSSGPVPAGVRSVRASFDLPNALSSVLDSEE